MKKHNGYWTDENNNRWSCVIYSEDQAEVFSKTLFDCKGCVNCTACIRCTDCTDCTDCARCIDCLDCTRCIDCTNCTRCADCTGCLDCTRCIDCTNCTRCADCSTLKRNPQRYLSGNIGSRHSQTCFYWLKDKTQVVCGCWRGTLEEFEERVNEVYPEGKYGNQYRAEIEKVKYLMS
jgi:hypothetical protein